LNRMVFVSAWMAKTELLITLDYATPDEIYAQAFVTNQALEEALTA